MRIPVPSAAALRAVGTVLLALTVWATPALAHAESNGDVTWSVRAAGTEAEPARQSFTYELAPGQQIHDALVVTNNGDTELSLDTYAADGFTTDSGQLDVLPRAETSQQLGTWIRSSDTTITLAPRASANVAFTLTVPENATPGDYTAGIITSLVVPQDSGVSVDRRLGLRVRVRVTGEVDTRLIVTDAAIDYHAAWNPFVGGSAMVSYTVRNDGNTRASATQAVTIHGPFGIAPITAPASEPIPELLPGEQWDVTVAFDQAPPLFWLATRIALTLTPPPEFSPPNTIEPATGEAATAATPWSQLVLLLSLAGAVVWGIHARRTRKKREDARVEDAVTRALAEARPPGTGERGGSISRVDW